MRDFKILSWFLIITIAISSLAACDTDGVVSGGERNETSSESSVSNVSTVQNSVSSENKSSESVSSVDTSSSESSIETSSKAEENNDTENDKNDEKTTVEKPERDPSKNETEQWYMVLANPDNSISKEYISAVNKATIDSNFSTNRESSKYLDSRVVEAFEAMCKAAKKDGIKLYSVSAYRSYSYQETLFKNRVQRVINEEGLPEKEATEKAATIVARPGTSEHHLGLAVDINSVETKFEKTKEFKWLKENAENFGFIMRYPKDKQEITKIIYEPWHYRYVGVEHAKEINRLGLCFEEYIEYLNGSEIQENG